MMLTFTIPFVFTLIYKRRFYKNSVQRNRPIRLCFGPAFVSGFVANRLDWDTELPNVVCVNNGRCASVLIVVPK